MWLFVLQVTVVEVLEPHLVEVTWEQEAALKADLKGMPFVVDRHKLVLKNNKGHCHQVQ